MPEQESGIRVAIIGAGIAGMTAALRLSERGYKVTVFEARHDVGGRLGGHPRRFSVAAGDVDENSQQLDRGQVPPRWRQATSTQPHFSAAAKVSVVDEKRAWRITDGVKTYDVTLWKSPRLQDGAPIEQLLIYERPYDEHCYHMYMNWYHNFWGIVDKLGIRGRFKSRTTVKFASSGQYGDYKELTNFGSLKWALPNLFSGIVPVPDMFLAFYGILDLMCRPSAIMGHIGG